MDPIRFDNEHDELQYQLSAYALGELDETQAKALEARLKDDPALQAELEEIRALAGRLTDALQRESQAGDQLSLSPQQKQAIHDKADGAAGDASPLPARLTQTQQHSRRVMWWRSAGALTAAAACVAVFVMLHQMDDHREPARSPNGQPEVAMDADEGRLAKTKRDEGKETVPYSRQPFGFSSELEELPSSGQRLDKDANAPARHQQDGGSASGSRPLIQDREYAEHAAPSTPVDKLTEGLATASKSESSTRFSGLNAPLGEVRDVSQQSHELSRTKLRLNESSPVSSQPQPAAAPTSRLMPETSSPIGIDASEDRRIAGPRFNTEAYDAITDNAFLAVMENPLSTFSIDVDTASYANVRRFLNYNQLPPAGAVRIEELVNYFPYHYAPPAPGKDDKAPFAVHVETGSAPWAQEHRLVKIGIKGKELAREEKQPMNLVFLIDVSGSMMSQDKLPLLKEGMKLLVNGLDETDHVAIVVYAGAAGMVLDATPGSQKQTILAAIDKLTAGGSTNGAAGIQLAYELAQRHFNKEAVNRVILASDGDFNVGVSSKDQLIKLIEEKRKTGVFLSVLGFGTGNLKDANMEQIANKGNGQYHYIDSIREARKVLVEQMTSNLVTIAKDVKIQVEFNPAKVQAYRLIGYENRLLAKEDFNDDTKDAGEIGAGHTVTAIYEVVPVGVKMPGVPSVDPLKYQPVEKPAPAGGVVTGPASEEMLTVKLRYKQPDGDVSTKLDVPVVDPGKAWQDASPDFRFVAAVAQFGMLLRNSPHKGTSDFAQVLDLAQSGLGQQPDEYRQEFIQLVQKAREIQARQQQATQPQ